MNKLHQRIKTLFPALLLTLTFFFFSVIPAKAATAWTPDPASIINTQLSGKASLENLAGANWLLGIIYSLFGAVGAPRENANQQSYNGGAVGAMSNFNLAMAQKPGDVSTVEYLADMGQSLGIVPKEAFAQGTGFTSLSPVLTVWKVMRDFVYLIYVIVFFIVGFMILMRKKIDPRTVISVETALPKLVIGLILITFSYAIISFMVDIGNLATRIIAAFFVGKTLIINTGEPAQAQFLKDIFSSNIFYLARPIGDSWHIGEHAGNLASSGLLDPLGPFAKITTAAIFGFASLFITFKIFFALLGPYVGIVLSIIFAPFEILFATIPGGEASFTNWIKNVLAKVAVFPVAFFLILLAASFGSYNPNNNWICMGTKNCFNWQPTGESGLLKHSMENLNLILAPFGNWSGVVGDLIAFGILFTIPATVQLVQNALKVKDQSGDIAQQTIMRGMSKVPGLKSLAER